MSQRKPNLVFVFADQWRLEATGYAGNPDVRTPNLDALAGESVNFTTAVSGCPVCTPARGSLITGQYPLTHGVFVNDVHLERGPISFADTFNRAGYDTGYIGKWHLDGRGRSSYIGPEDRQGFEFWHVRECNHDYWDSFFYADEPVKRYWPGYDAQAQTADAQQYIRDHARSDRPFALVLSWGPPHSPYHTAPQRYRQMYDPAALTLRENVPTDIEEQAREDLAGYYAHCTALDQCLGDLLQTLDETDLAEDTVFVFWSDHGDMVGSRGAYNKQQPWDESIMVPLLIRHPRQFGRSGRIIDTPVNTPDLLPTLAGLCGIDVPETAEGHDYAPCLRGQAEAPADAALIACYVPFGQWTRDKGGREFRGVRTTRYTYARSLEGPWLLYDNEKDPCQLRNLIDDPEHRELQAELEGKTRELLARTGDAFEHAEAIIDRWGYEVDGKLTVPYVE